MTVLEEDGLNCHLWKIDRVGALGVIFDTAVDENKEGEVEDYGEGKEEGYNICKDMEDEDMWM